MSTPVAELRTRWVAVGSPDDIPAQGARVVLTQDAAIAVFKTVDGRIFALEDHCPHKGGPLSQGIVHGDCVSCPLHGMKISLAEGKALAPDEGEVRRYPVKSTTTCCIWI
ncbi:nitrite reductase (NAD(P)H) small subunit [Alkalilimnicola ehrlichii]|uniref:Nitrite reductase (NAD(P)H) small subunit n=1 Tax=Alkalilimnicola ehrlichii TaxID=351052 RepID=A0A3E0WZ95_9GAMM|nr:nitrite reductase small subunit NirD [Alkalilimnicola ehrlichii]RFA30775.1 nitrite reductase (NAD(P)H) small subunit [Alkalilimnicola ehrlichii]RFA38350.1 nitrite reductase (NAD(P)H) small subunit [Alkalilimnicola ehrlichii]